MDTIRSYFDSSPQAGRLHEALYDAATKASATAIIGLTLRAGRYSAASAFFGHSVGAFTARLVINVSKAYALALHNHLDRLSERAWVTAKSNPNMRLFLVAMAVGLALFSPTLAFLLGGGAGAFSALTIDREICDEKQNQDTSPRHPSIAGLMQQVL